MQGKMPIIASLVAGVLAILLLNVYISDLERSLQPSMTQVMVTARPIRAGAVLEAKDVAMGQKPTSGVPALAIKWEERGNYIGQQVDLSIPSGDYVLQSYFGGQAVAAQRLSEKVDAKGNQRALTIPVTNETSLERSIRPGDRLDLLLSYNKAETTAQAPGAPAAPRGTGALQLVTTTLLENVFVLYTGRFGQTPRADYSSITVLVSPDEGKLLVWGMSLGKLSILLRNPKDLLPTDRATLAGDTKTLDQLGGPAMRISDVVAKPAAQVP